MLPERGILTFEAEGLEAPGYPYHSRVLHVPSDNSGLTIGRGYDMKHRAPQEVMRDLCAAKVDPKQAARVCEGAGLVGETARSFIDLIREPPFEISEAEQVELFKITYERYERTARRICNKSDVVKAYGATDWDNLHSAIREVVVDLLYRGDYTPSKRKFLQRTVSSNDLEEFTHYLSDPGLWVGVPSDRFHRRKNYLQAALSNTV